MRNSIYISFPPYVAKVLKAELVMQNGESIRISPGMRATAYWKHKFPYMSSRSLAKQPSMHFLFISALREYGQEHIGKTTNYGLAFSQRMVDANPELVSERHLVPFRMPLDIPVGTGKKDTSDNTLMDKVAGQQFRQAMIYHFYDVFKSFLAETERESAMLGESWNPSEAVQLFCDKYDLSSDDYFNLLRQYYRHNAM